MTKARLFTYAVLFHPTEKEAKEGEKSKLLVEPKTILALDENTVKMQAAMGIAEEYRNKLDQIEIAVRPF